MGASQYTVGSLGGKVLYTANAPANGTYFSGPTMTEARGFKNWVFSLATPTTISGYSVTVYGTLDSSAVLQNGQPNPNYPNPGSAGGNWFALNPGTSAAAPADVANPLTATSSYCPFSGPLVAVCVAVVASTASGTINVLGFAAE